MLRYRFVYSLCAAAFLAGTFVQSAAAQENDRAVPRHEDGRPMFYVPGEQVLWQGAFAGMGTPGNADWPLDDIPWMDWARSLYVYRQTHELEPHARCKASGATRQFQTPYNVEFVEVPELQRMYIFDVGGPYTWRTIYMDGRQHPDMKTYKRNGYGHSIGWWEGETLVIETVGFDESFWLDRRGIPHTEDLRTIERFARPAYNQISYEIEFHDPKTFTEPWSGSFNFALVPNMQLFEFICQQANYADELMLGHYEEVDRTSPIIP